MNEGKTLIVARDRAHVRELSKKFLGVEVISASAFFDRVRLLCFLFYQKERDDHAPLIEAVNILSKDRMTLKQAHRFSSLYSSFFHGTCTPGEVLKKIGPEDADIKQVVEVLAQMEAKLREKSLVNGVQALYDSWQLIKDKEILPFGLLGIKKVILYYLIDLTLLEMEVVKALSRLSLSFEIRLPLLLAPGVNVAVDFLAKQFESEADLFNIELAFEDLAEDCAFKPLVDGLFTDQNFKATGAYLNKASSVHTEADDISVSIANILKNDPQAKIAISTRKIDRSGIYLRSLNEHGIGVKGRKGQVLFESTAGLLLETIFQARLLGLPKKEFLGLINHPAFIFSEPDQLKRSKILALIGELGIDDRHLSLASPTLRYQNHLERFLKIDGDQEGPQYLSEFLEKVSPVLLSLSLSNSLGQYLREVLHVLEKAFDPLEPSFIHLQQAIKLMAKSSGSFDGPKIALEDFLALLKAELKSLTIPSADQALANSVEFLLLPELLGRKFDHVFIAGITAGTMPQNQVIDPLMDDRARVRLNSIMGKPMLRVYFDDPFEPMPVPPRQALEPFWFACGMASAQAVHFSHGVNDEKDQEQAPSEFFIWLEDRVKPKPKNQELFIKKQYQRFLQGSLGLELDDLRRVALTARKKAFLNGETHDLAFLVDRESIKEMFSGRLSEKPHKALTPTMVEAFSGCRFKGYAARILNLKGTNLDQDDVDARLIGQIAHEVLEKFVKTRSEEPAVHLKEVLKEVSEAFCKKQFIKNPEVLSCHLDWLFDMLLSLIMRLEENSLEKQAEIFATEADFGLSRHGFAPVKLAINDRRYLLGGRVDRIDKLKDGFLIYDYKLSRSDNLRTLLSGRNLLKSHFQAPIYLRLLAQAFSLAQNEVAFALASIRDGELVFMSEKDPELWPKIFEDDRPDGLAYRIDEIFSPIARGEILATKGESCTNCEVSFFCRKAEALDV